MAALSPPAPAVASPSPSPPLAALSDAELQALSRAGLATVEGYHQDAGLRGWKTIKRTQRDGSGVDYVAPAETDAEVNWDDMARKGDFSIVVQWKPLPTPAKSVSPAPVPVKSPEPAASTWGGWAASFIPAVVTNSVSAVVGVADTPRYVWKGVGLVPQPPEHLFRLFHDQENQASWNKALLESRVLRTIKGSRTSITYAVSAPAAGGAVSSRDFIDTHDWSRTERTDAEGHAHVDFVFAGAGLTEEQYVHPSNAAYVRGLNGPAGFILRSVRPPSSHASSADPNVRWTQFVLILDCDCKGWVPKSVVDNATPDIVLDYVANIRNVWQKRLEQNTPLPPMAPEAYE